MNVAENLLLTLASIGDEHECESTIEHSTFPENQFWTNGAGTTLLWSSCVVSMCSVARGIRQVLLNTSIKSETATLYLQMIASEGCVVEELFDVFSFTLSWQALRDYMVSACSKKSQDVTEGDECDENGPDVAATPFSWSNMRVAMSAAQRACARELLEGRNEALESAFDNCSAVLRFALAHTEAKTHSARDVADTAVRVLQQLLRVHSAERTEIALSMLLHLVPGLFGCPTLPRGGETFRPQTTILEATISVVQDASLPIRTSFMLVMQTAIQRAPEKAPLRNMLSMACCLASDVCGNDFRCELLHFLGTLLCSNTSHVRRLGVQCLEEMAMAALEHFPESVEDEHNLLAGSTPEEFALALCVQRSADTAPAVRARAMSAISKVVTKLLQIIHAAGSGQGTERRLSVLAEVVCGERALVMDASAVADWLQQANNAHNSNQKEPETDGQNQPPECAYFSILLS